MKDEQDHLHDLIRSVRRRRRLLLALRGTAACVGSGALILLLAGWVALRYQHAAGVVLSLRLTAVAVFLTGLYLFLIRPLLRRISDGQLARLIEERAPDLANRFVSAVEFGTQPRAAEASPAIVERLVADANERAAVVDLDTVVRRRRLWLYAATSVLALLGLAAILLWGPRPLVAGVTRLVTPTALAAGPDDALSIAIRPGSARVPRNSDQRIVASLANLGAETVTFFSRPTKSESATEWVGQTMEPARARSDFQFVIFSIQDSIEYFVEANGVRSETYRLDVVDLPFVKQIDLRLDFPAFTRTATKTIVDGGDIAAVKGTVAHLTARLTGKVKAARAVLGDGGRVELQPDTDNSFSGAIIVSANTSYYIELVSLEGETYRGSNEHDITVLEDQPPTVTFDRPGRDLRATSLEEVFTQVKAEDDYGVVGLELFYSVNGGAEQKVGLEKLNRDGGRSAIGTHTFFLEEYQLKPGDVVSYYARARDAASESSSDIYFIEIKPFGMQFRQAQQSGGGGGSGEQQNALTQRQKDLIAATFRLVRDGDKYSAQERSDAYNVVAEGQRKLRDDTLAFADRMQRRLAEGIGADETLSKLLQHVTGAAQEMETALPPLQKQGGKDALPAEQRALQHLLSMDAMFREAQVAFGNQQGASGSNSQQSQELAELFELELDKMKNQYESLRREQRQQSQQGRDEMARKLEELARRQQQALDQQRRQQGQPRNAAAGGGSQRQQQELIDETRQTARELERLSRERRDPRLQEMSRELQQAADEMQRAQAAAGSSREEAAAQARRALARLEQAQRRLQASGQAGQRQDLSDLRQRAAEAASRQREIARDVDQLARRQARQGTTGSEGGQKVAERKEALAEALSGLREDMEQTARQLGDKSGANQQLREAAGSLRRNRVPERIREDAQRVARGEYQSAQPGERSVQQSLNDLVQQLESAERGAGRPSASAGEEALERARQLGDSLEGLRQRMERNAGQQERGEAQRSREGGQGRQAGNQGRQSGDQGQPAGGAQGGTPYSGQPGSPNGRNGESEARQLGAELRERLNEARELRGSLGSAGADLTNQLDQAIASLARLANNLGMQDAQTAGQLKAQVIDPIRQLELALSKRLDAKLDRTNLRLADEGETPGRYRKSVDEYYKRLSRRGLSP
jgi:hypothetical protein